MELRFDVGDQLGDTGHYRFANEPGQIQEGRARPVGQGSAGTVFCVRFKDSFLRAVKLHDPKHGLSGQVSADYLSTFKKETQFLCGLNHQNLIKILDFDLHLHGDVRCPYYVMDYIEGQTFLEACRDPAVSGVEILQLFEDVINVVAYLHAQGVLHADIKSANLRCKRSHERMKAVLLDLGAAHRLPEDPHDTSDEVQYDPDDKTLFVSTPEIAHPEHRHKIGKLITRGELAELFPYYDLYAIGVLLQEVLKDPSCKDKLLAHLGHDGLSALEAIRDQLLVNPQHAHYHSAAQLKGDWRKLDAGYLAPMGIPEMSIAAQFRYAMLGPSDRTIVTERLQSIIHHKLFQRLRDIPQLEYVKLKYNGATHNRLQHSITVYSNAKKYIAHLLNHARFELAVSEHDVEACFLLALLHDIGHYQLSHMFEDYAAEQRLAKSNSPGFRIPDDDDLFPAVFDGGAQEYYPGAPYSETVHVAWERSVHKLDGVVGRTIAQEVAKKFSHETVAAMQAIRATMLGDTPGNPAHAILAGVLSSPIDADKVSYLMEDAHATGVTFGKAVDLDGLLGALMPPETRDIKGPTIGITDKGIAAAESIAMARQLMIRQVYWHHTNRSIMAMVKYAISRLLSADALDFAEYLELNLFSSMEEAAAWIFAKFQTIRQDGEVNPIGGLLEGERRYYNRFLTIPNGGEERQERIHTRLRAAGYEEVLRLEHLLAEHLSAAVGLPIRHGEVLLDVPVKDRSGPGGRSSARLIVYPRDSHISQNGSGDIGRFTPWFSALREEHESQANKVRVFLAPHHFQEIRQRKQLRRLQEATERMLLSP